MLLIVHRSAAEGRVMADIFFRMGILAFAKRPMQALNEISLNYSAVLAVDPELLPDEEDYLSKMASYAAGIPTFALCESTACAEQKKYFSAVFSDGSYAPKVASGMVSYAQNHGLRPIGDYRLAGINACPSLGKITYFDRELPLTRTEAMLLRFLIRTDPIPTPSDRLINALFPPGRLPGSSDIRTHICSVNRKFRALTGQNLISPSDRGYYLLTLEKLFAGV